MYIVVSSADCRELFPENNGGNFKVKLKDTLHFNSTFKVALAEIVYKRTWNNIFSSNHYLTLEYKENIAFKEEQEKWLKDNVFNKLKRDFYISETVIGLKYELFGLDRLPLKQINFQQLMDSLVTTYKNFVTGVLLYEVLKPKDNGKKYRIKFKVDTIPVKLSLALTTALGITPNAVLNLSWEEWEIQNNYLIDWDNDNTEPKIKQIKIEAPTAHYTTASDLLSVLNNISKNYGLLLSQSSKTVAKSTILEYTPHNNDAEHWWRIRFSDALRDILGFTVEQENQLETLNSKQRFILTSALPMELRRTTEALWVYCNIVKPQYIGSSDSPLLRIVPYTGNVSTSTLISFNPMQYVPLSLHKFDIVHIQIFETFGKQPLQFESDVIVKLHFQ